MGTERVKIKTVSALIKIIRMEISKGKQLAAFAFEKQKAITFWNIGKHIQAHLLYNKGKIRYGDYLFEQLSRELNIGIRTLYWAVQFYIVFPEFISSLSQLTWTHYKLLLRIEDSAIRRKYEAIVFNENLNTRELEDLLRKDKLIPGSGKNPAGKLPIYNSVPYIYMIKRLSATRKLQIDLGFKIYMELPESTEQKCKENDYVKMEINDGHYAISLYPEAEAVHLYNYLAYIDEIIDGDTIWMSIELGFGISTRQKVRLRGINTPEISTDKGIKAKHYVVSRLKQCAFVFVKTHWRDKFNRYLVDIFYNRNVNDINLLVNEGTFLNQEMLDNGLGERY